MTHFEEDVDRLDAAVFSGDALFDMENRKLLTEHLERWGRKIKEFQEMSEDIAKEELEQVKAAGFPKNYCHGYKGSCEYMGGGLCDDCKYAKLNLNDE